MANKPIRTSEIAGPDSTFAALVSGMDIQRTDVLYQDFRVYLEGIEVPLIDVHISEPYMALPVATVSLPYFPGMTEIGRNYFPKIHIFFRDVEAERYFRSQRIAYTDEDIYRLKFAGVVHRYSYSMQKTSGGASRQFSLHCSHKYYVLNEIVTMFGARGPESPPGTPGADGVLAKVSSYFGSAQMALDCMKPVKAPSATAKSPDSLVEDMNIPPADIDITVLPEGMKDYISRVQGIPGYLTNMWGALKRDSYSTVVDGVQVSRPMIDMYIPLLDSGLKFFQRMSGHPLLETGLKDGVSTAGSEAASQAKKGTDDKVVLPPIMHTSIGAAASVDLTLAIMNRYLEYTGQTGTLMEIFRNTMSNLRYDMNILASPVQPRGVTEGVDTVVKPVMVTYYSPTCNVLLPTMYDSLNIEEGYYGVPTRVSAVDQIPVLDNNAFTQLQFRAPHLYRKAVVDLKGKALVQSGSKGTLLESMSFVFEAVGSHELGQGIIYKFVEVEPWARFLFAKDTYEEFEKYSNEGKYETKIEENLSNAWLVAHGPLGIDLKNPGDINKLNPWAPTDVNGLQGAYRNLMATLEYDYSLSLVQSRVGRVSGVFNPYIVAGYPCDVISKNSYDPSYHAFVTSVDTTYSSSGYCGTAVTFSSAFTYHEFEAYQLPATQPWLAATLSLTDNVSMVQPSEAAMDSASDYYKGVLGVGAAFPLALYNFEEMRGNIPIISPTGDIDTWVEWPLGLTGEYLTIQETSNKSLSTEASLAMTRREIETMGDVAKANEVTFIHLPRTPDGLLIESPEQTSIVDSARKTRRAKSKEGGLNSWYLTTSVGKSVFLDYPDDTKEV